ncbi:hypothetical protein K450DRAFT_197696 [Umbelopsis ramanniana AG]|uniref:Arrestin C-terminal-like domain-containing protein n=1 Tax=Umbelopsis ramanniana AG TaxID=1314678 RepID=A0AAD5EE04_UMBRA|nr:uncharacterized protein K450DRAFT_197696 [Umbelopsis ramanniana AG]KAI8581592.1 hypothetical protein K450DRAFT_197696 [Umbelopsis ramanniana AG]
MPINLFCASSLSMKDAFDEISIAPLDSYIDLCGTGETQPCYIFKGDIHLTLNKPVKIRSMEIKFKGTTMVNMGLNTIGLGHDTATTFGKMKQVLVNKSSFSAGSSSIPWEFAIPPHFPQTLSLKRASLAYSLEVVVSFGIKKSLRVSCPVTIRRPTLPSYQLAPYMESRLYKATIPTKFHYEIEAPTLACIEQEELVYSVKLLLFSLDKTVRAIKTTLVQVESYRSQPQSNHQWGHYLKHSAQPEWKPSEQSFDHTCHVLDPKSFRANGTGTLRDLTKPAPSVTHNLDDNNIPSSWTKPLVLRQPISQQFNASVDSPLLTISHQLHITLTLIHKIDEITIKVPIILSSHPYTTPIPPTQPATTTILDSKDLRIRPPSEYSDEEISEKNMDEEDMISEDELSSSSDEEEVNQYTPAATTKFTSENALSSTLRPPSSIAMTPTTLVSAHTFGRPVRRFASALDLSVMPQDSFEALSSKQKPLLTIDVSLANNQPGHLRIQQAAKHLSLRKSTSAEQLISFRSSETLPESDRQLMSKLLRSEQNKAYGMLHNQESNIHLKGVRLQPTTIIEQPSYTKNNPSLPYKQHSRSVSHPTSTASISFLQLDDDNLTVSSLSNNSDVAPSLSSTGSASTGTTRSNPLQSRPPTPVLSYVPALPGTTILHQPIQNYSLPEEDFPAPLTATTVQSTIASSGLISPANPRLRSYITHDSSSDKYETLTFSSSGHESLKFNTRTPSTIVGREEVMRRYIRSATPQQAMQNRRPEDVLRVKTSRMTRLYDEDAHDEVLDPLPPVPQVPQYNVKAKTRSTVTEYSSDYESNSDESYDFDRSSFNFLAHDPHARSTTPLPRLPRLSFGASFASALGVIDDDGQS